MITDKSQNEEEVALTPESSFDEGFPPFSPSAAVGDLVREIPHRNSEKLIAENKETLGLMSIPGLVKGASTPFQLKTPNTDEQ